MRRLVTVTLVVGSMLLAGCRSDADPEPKVSPTESSSVTPTPTPTGPVEPTLPAEAEGDDAAAAEAFVRFYWEMADYAQNTGDVAGLRKLSAQSCVACRAGMEFIEQVYAEGGSISGGETRTSGFETAQIKFRGNTAFQVKLDVENADQVVDRGGAGKDETFPADVVRANFVVSSENGPWGVVFWEAS
jgi:hypothetical protein